MSELFALLTGHHTLRLVARWREGTLIKLPSFKMTDLVSSNEEDKDPDIELFVKVRMRGM